MLPMLFADFGTAIGIFFTIVVPIILVISQVISAVKNPENQPGGKQQGQGGGQPPNQPKPQRAEALSDEIDKFLQKMANPGAAEEEVAEVEVLEPHEVERVPLAQEGAQRRPFAPAEVVPVEPVQQPSNQSVFSDSVTSHVDEHIGGSSFDQQVSRLGSVTGQADERVEERLQETFDHQVGNLAKEAVYRQERIEDTSIQAAELAPLSPHDYDATTSVPPLGQSLSVGALLASPEGIRNAIILNEILRRPDERW